MTKIIAEAGISHCGSVEHAKQLALMAKDCGAEYLKFQKRTPELSVSRERWSDLRCTPFGIMSKIDYRRKVEFGLEEYREIDAHCRQIGIEWFVSVWDLPSLDFMLMNFPDTPYIKIPSARMQDRILQKTALDVGKDIIVSTGMHSQDEIQEHLLWMVNTFGSSDKITIMHCTSSYPVNEDEVNLDAMVAYQGLRQWPYKIGFSSHAVSPFVPILAIAYAQPTMVETHIALDRAGKGGDDHAALENKGLELLVRERDRFYRILGDGKLRLYDSELSSRNKLRV